jgi:hypothetical protein
MSNVGMRFENYVVYPDGRIWSDYKKDFLVPQDNGTGYLKVLLRINGKPQNRYVHRLVATAFLPKPFGFDEVNHIDGNKKNNTVENLEWCTCLQNKQHAANNGLTNKGEKNHAHKLTEEQIKNIRSEYVYGSKDRGQRALARKYHVSQTAIRYILNGTNWRYCFGF